MATTVRPDRLVGLLLLPGVMALAALPALAPAGDEVPQMVRGGGVVVRATRLPAEGQILRFRVEMDTHMRDLDRYEFGEIVRVRDATGKEHAPASIEWLMGGGHHRAAILRFPPLDPGAQVVELLVRDVAGVRERVFRWALRALQGPEQIPPDGPSRLK